MKNKAKYYLYRNLHKGGFSVKHKGLVCARGDSFIMENVEFRVSQNGNKRVKNEKRKNVHAYMVSESYKKLSLCDLLHLDKSVDDMIKITYNPYKNDTFVEANTGKPVTRAEYAIAVNGKVYVR